MVEIFKGLSDENRLRIINLLLQRSLCVCDIEKILEISQSNASRHLNKLKNCGIIAQEKKAQWVFHRIDENFLKENPLLVQYLKEELKKSEKMQRDLEKLKGHTVTCIS
ncbi:transcriptional regulator, ArsR family [Anaerobranca californiensis DSM 14826]|jgi:ArsR family transcriptional regulator|uniref:Transcriptional regulator, ArsR family n=1 Tax=Anaerobranca californiensis DSM 14826 TaxID=1120989 RepID=A0A1M6R1W6_9FIRM|nr:metalloregulator ArsR/SmtB family transcription factor [Anaerobranca californiensis]SHK26444.1 transcriptional regulator, ArsR family [Anaerobranca californiensis DSM 14826]